MVFDEFLLDVFVVTFHFVFVVDSFLDLLFGFTLSGHLMADEVFYLTRSKLNALANRSLLFDLHFLSLVLDRN